MALIDTCRRQSDGLDKKFEPCTVGPCTQSTLASITTPGNGLTANHNWWRGPSRSAARL